MIFTADAGIDRSQQVITNIYSSKRIQETNFTRIFIDYIIDPLVTLVLPNKSFIGTNPLEGNVGVWNSMDELILNLRNHKPYELNVNGFTQSITGLCTEHYDVVTNAFFIKSNSLGIKQASDPTVIYMNFLAYMLAYRMIKMSGDNPGEPVKSNDKGKPRTFSVQEHDLFQAGLIPIAIFSDSDPTELKQELVYAIESTCLANGMLKKPAFNVKGKLVDGYETIWISKLELYKFLEALYPNYYNTYGYGGLNTKMALVGLMDYMDKLNLNYLYTDLKAQQLNLPQRQNPQYVMYRDWLGIDRMVTVDEYNSIMNQTQGEVESHAVI